MTQQMFLTHPDSTRTVQTLRCLFPGSIRTGSLPLVQGPDPVNEEHHVNG